MHLTPEQKAIGKENFHAAIGSKLVRRTFLQDTINEGLKSGKGLGAKYFGYGTVDEPIKVAVLGTGDEGSVLIGAINPEYIKVKAIADIRPYNQWRAFNGDHYSPTAYSVRNGLVKIYDYPSEEAALKDIDVYGDYKDLIADVKAGKLDIEAVIIGLPLHLHAPAAIAAMRAGLHVLTEKLMGHSVHECKEMARVAKETKKHLVTGHQRHYNILYDNAVKLMKQGLLGELHYIRCQWHRGNKPGSDSWQQPLPQSSKPGDEQAGKLEKDLEKWTEKKDGLEASFVRYRAAYQSEKDPEKKASLFRTLGNLRTDIELWRKKCDQKQAQLDDAKLDPTQYGYESRTIKGDNDETYDRPAMEELIRWRLWNRTGGGLMAELGSHQLDASAIFLAAASKDGEKPHPISVDASTARMIFPLDREVADHVYCLFEFPTADYDPEDELNKHKKVTVQYASINGNGFDDYGETVYGTKGTLILERETRPFLFDRARVDDKVKVVQVVDDEGKLIEEIAVDEEGDEESAAIGLLSTSLTESPRTQDISRGYTEEEEHWAYCIRENPEANEDGPRPRCHPQVAMTDAIIALTTNLSAEKEEKIYFKEEWFDIDSDETPEGIKPDTSRYDA